MAANKELSAVVKSIQKSSASVPVGPMTITTEMVGLLAELKKVLDGSQAWTNKPGCFSDLVAHTPLEFAALSQLRANEQSAIEQKAARITKSAKK